ncbi:MAG TPA: ATP-binding protein [Candidatus Cybelea sp.]|nr:ATP-binding protein [Candidatus Cybelea sp.]
MSEAVSLPRRPSADAATAPKVRGRLFRKYVMLFVAVVLVALLANGLFEIWFSYQEHRASLVRIQHEQAVAAAAKIEQFVKEIQSELGWTTQLPWTADTLEQHSFDALRLLRQVPAITELSQLDATGHERLRVSRLDTNVIDSKADFSREPKFVEAVAHKVWYGPVYFRGGSEPYMTLAVAGARRDAGVSIAEVNLKLIWDVVSQIKVGENGRAYVVDGMGRLIAHPDISLVLRDTDLSQLPQVRAARSEMSGATAQQAQAVRDIQGREVLSAHAPIQQLGWLVFVELPLGEAYAPLYASIERSGALLFAGLLLAILAGLFLARKMVVPIQALRAGAARIGGGDLAQRITVKTGDELEALADQFNDMAGRLHASYAELESRVKARTQDLARSLEDLKAAQNRLIQSEKMASLGQLTAGIAHEIKNPLNFVNNFAGLSADLLAELKDMVAKTSGNTDPATRAEIDDIMATLVTNLGKIGEHGRRADGIVKSMLLHSRGGSGELQDTDLNALIEDALVLTYHGLRAQDQSFNITIERDYDPAAGMISAVPQDLTRVFLNLISNGFYAANKRKRDGGDPQFSPRLKVSTRNLGGKLEVRVRDNGVGISDEVRAKLFMPFFTTKPTGEGTGLGLSISYEIVTREHGGSIAVESQLGEFTEFILTLPRGLRGVKSPAESKEPTI